MFIQYLRRELGKRKRQTVVVASGLAIAIGLAVVVQAASTGVAGAQSAVLQSMYGIGTDVAVTRSSPEGFGPQRFEVGGDAGRTQGDSRTFSRSRLRTAPGTDTLTATELSTIADIEGVTSVTGSLTLTSTTFNGELPAFMQQGTTGGQPAPMPDRGSDALSGSGDAQQPQGGFDGRGGSAFDISSFSVQGVDPSVTDAGAMANIALVDGRLLTQTDAGASVALISQGFSASDSLTVGAALAVGGESMTVVGIVRSTSTEGSTTSDVYLPLDVAQRLSGLTGVTTVAVTIDSADHVGLVTDAISAALPDATVNSAATLADSISGSLGTASSLIVNLGKWLSLLVLLAAFLLAMLLTASGVQRRTREFGTLKAIGWRSGRIVRQVVGESIVTGVLGGILGIAIGALGVAAVNAFAPELTATTAGFTPGGTGPGGGFPGGGFGGFGGRGEMTTTSTSVALQAALSGQTLLMALGLALLGGVLAGAFGGWRAARLRPAAALRSVA